jgi:DNA repair exonuclease SbcCD ATPase subunit
MITRYEFTKDFRNTVYSWLKYGVGELDLATDLKMEAMDDGGFALIMKESDQDLTNLDIKAEVDEQLAQHLPFQAWLLGSIDILKQECERKAESLRKAIARNRQVVGELRQSKADLASAQASLEQEREHNLTARLRDEELASLYARNTEVESQLITLQNKLDSVDHNWTKEGIKRIMAERDAANERLNKIKQMLLGQL